MEDDRAGGVAGKGGDGKGDGKRHDNDSSENGTFYINELAFGLEGSMEFFLRSPLFLFKPAGCENEPTEIRI